MGVSYRVGAAGLTAEDLAGFFVGWPARPASGRRGDPDLRPLYERLGLAPFLAMAGSNPASLDG